jgi:hypothetical protein
MTTTQDELRELWSSQPSVATTTGEDLMRRVEERTRKFDRRVRARNLREIIASVIGGVVLGWTMLGTHDPWKITGGAVMELGLAVIIYVLLRYGQAGGEPDPSGTLSDYTRSLMARYDRQIRLLKTAKYWYLLPMFVGIVIMAAGSVVSHARAGTLGTKVFIWPAVLTAFFAFTWWLNEVYAVGKLEQCRAKTEAMLREG